MDKTTISKLQELERYIDQLKKFQKYQYDEIENDLEKIWAIEHGLQICIQVVMDIGNHILASIGENQVEDYTDIIDKLGKCKIIPPQFANKIRGMAGFRNILVHRYAEVDLKTVYDLLQNRLDDFMQYIAYIQAYAGLNGV